VSLALDAIKFTVEQALPLKAVLSQTLDGLRYGPWVEFWTGSV
jgi:hypothetical protein